MSDRVVSLFSFGLLLLAIGVLGNFLKWSQANILIGLGLIFELLAIVVIAWNKIKDRS